MGMHFVLLKHKFESSSLYISRKSFDVDTQHCENVKNNMIKT